VRIFGARSRSTKDKFVSRISLEARGVPDPIEMCERERVVFSCPSVVSAPGTEDLTFFRETDEAIEWLLKDPLERENHDSLLGCWYKDGSVSWELPDLVYECSRLRE